MKGRPQGLAEHPAEWSEEVLVLLDKIVPTDVVVLDPMAGTGWRLEEGLPGRALWGIELEPEWTMGAVWVQQGDATALPFEDDTFDWVVTSPTYANRMADHHNAQERCKPCKGTGRRGRGQCSKCGGEGRRTYKRLTYRHRLGRPLSEGSTASLGWLGKEGEQYREIHERAWREVWRVLVPGGGFALNVKNHYRTLKKGEPAQEMLVAEWHVETLEEIGFEEVDRHLVATPGMLYGQNREVRAEHEYVIVLRKPVDAPTSPTKG